MRNSLITYLASSAGRVRRQASTASTFNLTQSFAATGGDSYTLSAEAEAADNSNRTPSRSLQICGDTTCGPQTPLTSSYAQYSYTFTTASTESNVTSAFSFSCAGGAYVAVDDVRASGSNGSGTQTVISFITTTAPAGTLQTTRTVAGFSHRESAEMRMPHTPNIIPTVRQRHS